jgi:hypothetical protein
MGPGLNGSEVGVMEYI